MASKSPQSDRLKGINVSSCKTRDWQRLGACELEEPAAKGGSGGGAARQEADSLWVCVHVFGVGEISPG